jgi:hypothetical protein
MSARRRRGGDGDELCKALSQHAWEIFTPINMDAPWYGWRLSLRCVRCGTERHDNLSYATHQLLSRRYMHPEGYLYEKGERPTRQEFQEDLFTKLRGQLRESQGLGATDDEVWEDEDGKVISIKRGAKKSGGNRTAAKKAQGGRARRGA